MLRLTMGGWDELTMGGWCTGEGAGWWQSCAICLGLIGVGDPK